MYKHKKGEDGKKIQKKRRGGGGGGCYVCTKLPSAEKISIIATCLCHCVLQPKPM